MPYSTPIDVSNILNITFNSGTVPTDAQVADLILRGDSYVDRISGHNWLTNQTQEQHDAIGTGNRAGTIIVRNRPLLSVTALDPEQFPNLQSFYVYFPEGKIVWHKLRLDQRLRYRVTYTWGYTSVPDFVRDLSSCIAARDVILFWGSQLNVQEDISLFKKRLDERIFRLESRATRPSTSVGTA